MDDVTADSPEIKARVLGNSRLLQLADILDEIPDEFYLPGKWADCAGAYCAASWWAVHFPERWMFCTKGPMLKGSNCPWFSLLTEFDLNARELQEIFGVYGCRSTTDPREAAAFIREFVKIRGQMPRWLMFPGASPGAKFCPGVFDGCWHHDTCAYRRRRLRITDEVA